MTTILTNARLLTEGGVVDGTLAFDGAEIIDVQPGRSSAPGAIDAEGDFVSPGLIECHTDNLEKHFVPRPKVIWPNPLAAALTHDAQIVAAGITTVFDAVCIGGYDDGKDHRPKIMGAMIGALRTGREQGVLRADHRLHLRCEMTSQNMMDHLESFADAGIALASLMDHTPGQRQWQNLELYRTFVRGEGRSDEEIDAIIQAEIHRGRETADENFERAIAFFRGSGILLASHDDTTEQHIALAVAAGCTISEFPTTAEAARAAKEQGMATVGGAPNVARGGSHSGNVGVGELTKDGLIDVLSSDYVPASLLQAVQRLADEGMSLHEAIGLATWRPADMLKLDDRGRLKPGLRADLVRFRVIEGTPVVREVTVEGQRVF
ncbi:alpha-D-ribose 1-methylphosphonate 5-triphosphate diphosphatase [Flaviflagellibacter deserti]|uniref:Alpha-D-ribose 1-methylphosphonate 5-triphosphate diphosphatase n=1 Tax=Flaviflagellibacter deserti TaxID=2267266 RepID=A0ABV9YZY8_9HYPH